MEQDFNSLTSSSINSLHTWSCTTSPILPTSLFSPHAMSLHTSSTLSTMALLLHGGDAAAAAALRLISSDDSTIVDLVSSLEMASSSSLGFFVAAGVRCCVVCIPPIERSWLFYLVFYFTITPSILNILSVRLKILVKHVFGTNFNQTSQYICDIASTYSTCSENFTNFVII